MPDSSSPVVGTSGDDREVWDRSVSMGAANGYSLAFIVPLAGGLIGAYAARWGSGALADAWRLLLDHVGWAVLLLVAGTVVHELLHGAAWAVFARKPWSAIQIGFQWKTLTPFAHCREPMPVGPYRIGAAVPGLVLGLVPALAGIAAGWGGVFLFGLLFTVAAAGDLLILWLLRNVPAGRYVDDHPTRAGCLVLGPAPDEADPPRAR